MNPESIPELKKQLAIAETKISQMQKTIDSLIQERHEHEIETERLRRANRWGSL